MGAGEVKSPIQRCSSRFPFLDIILTSHLIALCALLKCKKKIQNSVLCVLYWRRSCQFVGEPVSMLSW